MSRKGNDVTGKRVFIIAEGGVNHNGSLAMAKQLADAALAAGADAVKFQTFRAEEVVTPMAETAHYQRSNTGEANQFEMIKKLELDEDAHHELSAYCRHIGIEFFSTPFSEEAVALLTRLDVRRIKLPSGEITNKSLLECAAATGLPLLLSSGMSTMAEVQTAIHWISAARQARGLSEAGSDNLTLLHCTSAYPAPADSLNLLAMQAMSRECGLPTGYSDHSEGIEAALAATALGACVIEKHLTLDTTLPGPDHLASADPATFTAMVRGIRMVETMRGDGLKRPQLIEHNTRDVARRSVVLSRDVPGGTVLTPDDLCLRRPGTGIAPAQQVNVLGCRLTQDMPAYTLLAPYMLEGWK